MANFRSNFGPPIFFMSSNSIVVRHHPMQFTEKITSKTFENDKKPHFGSDFGQIFFIVSFTSTRS